MKSRFILMSIFAILLFSTGSALDNPSFAQSDTWTTRASMPTPRAYPESGVIDGRLYVIDGQPPAGFPPSVFEAYDPVTDTWTTKAPPLIARSLNAAAAAGGKLYVVGGCLNSDCNSPTNRLDIYDPVTDSWTTRAAMPTTRFKPGIAVIDGKLYVVGGASAFSAPNLTTLEVYDPATNIWTTKASMLTRREGLRAIVIDGKLYAVGGFIRPENVWSGALEVYDPISDTWTTKASMPTAREVFGAGVIDGQLHVVGGTNATPAGLDTHEVYDPLTDSWITRAPLSTKRIGLVADVIDSQLYAVGGIVNCVPSVGCEASNLLEVYTAIPPVINVTIDIKPGSFPNNINLGSGGTVPIAIFSTTTFAATSVNPKTVTLASAPVRLRGNGTSMASSQDVNGDGLLDLVVHVSTEALQLSEVDTTAVLEGQRFNGTAIRGVDSVRIVH